LLEDKILVWRFKRGSTEALACIYEKYRDDLLRITNSLLSQTAAAEDIVHDVFVSFVRNRDKFELKGSLKAYLVTAAVNKVRNFYRAGGIGNIEEGYEPESKLHLPEQWIIENEQAFIINEAMAKLSYEQREVIASHIHGKLRFREIARLQGVSIKTAQSRYRYGIDKLRALLDGKVTL
jgi:RNA polymerase sigma-70 factor (ECF subfamily)